MQRKKWWMKNIKSQQQMTKSLEEPDKTLNSNKIYNYKYINYEVRFNEIQTCDNHIDVFMFFHFTCKRVGK